MTTADQYVLVTGANSGLGLGTCCRLIDEYLASPQAENGTLTIIFTTRSARKGSETLTALEKHLARHGSSKSDRKIYFQPENVELTSLLSIRALSRKLFASDLPHLNAIVLNAGIGGWSGLNWPLTIWTCLTGIRQATTWPTFKLGLVGLVTKPQFPQDYFAGEEPVLGEVFCANTFGHYMLVHWLMPLFRASPAEFPGKIIWSTSIEACGRHYNPDDHQGLKSSGAYEHTKRLGDLLALTAAQPATAKSVNEYTTPSLLVAGRSRPEQSEPMFLDSHPGICTTTIISLFWIVHEFYRLGIYLARWCGSPWGNVTAYLGAASATWLALASVTDIQAKKDEALGATSGGPCKWGSSVDRLGNSYIRVTDVEGWGLDGTGQPFKDKWWGGSLGRKTGSTDATEEDVESFVAQGVRVWGKMEALRTDWEARIEKYEAEHQGESNGHVSES
ncbi:3-keto-steroid reductase [Cladophialophora chaetospira]|uniref:3-keto-steroid reductase n=1 Tax=Cladophialophora chaetospira TaxID=386627 RepID=A0AA38X2G8_9EURO|nr:3-keto-steroid reductase [Cladophialophora chaetospira]